VDVGWIRNRILAIEAEARAASQERPQPPDDEIRQWLWTDCPHEGKYGDDGELQCRGVDFRRDPLLSLIAHVIRAASQERPQPPLHGHQVNGDWYECTDEHPGVAQERPQPTIEQLAAEQGVGPITNADDLRIDGLTDEEADAFVAALHSQERPQPDLRAALERVTEATWITDGDNKPICMLCDGRLGSEPDWCEAVKARAALSGVAQERPQPELPIWTEEQVAEGWIDPSPEACTCQRKDALGSYVPCSLHDVGVAQERPSIDVERLHREFGYLLDMYGAREDESGHWAVCRDLIARLAGGSVASPEPDE